jgi:hypothetical protein
MGAAFLVVQLALLTLQKVKASSTIQLATRRKAPECWRAVAQIGD